MKLDVEIWMPWCNLERNFVHHSCANGQNKTRGSREET